MTDEQEDNILLHIGEVKGKLESLTDAVNLHNQNFNTRVVILETALYKIRGAVALVSVVFSAIGTLLVNWYQGKHS